MSITTSTRPRILTLRFSSVNIRKRSVELLFGGMKLKCPLCHHSVTPKCSNYNMVLLCPVTSVIRSDYATVFKLHCIYKTFWDKGDLVEMITKTNSAMMAMNSLFTVRCSGSSSHSRGYVWIEFYCGGTLVQVLIGVVENMKELRLYSGSWSCMVLISAMLVGVKTFLKHIVIALQRNWPFFCFELFWRGTFSCFLGKIQKRLKTGSATTIDVPGFEARWLCNKLFASINI